MRRLGPAVAAALLVLTLAACSDDDSDKDSPDDATSGLLTASDMPFEDPQEGELRKPDPLTQLSRSCVGIEQDVLYDADWTVEARKYFDNDQWSVTTAVFTPPAGADDDGLAKVRDRSDQCMREETGSGSPKPLDLGNGTYAYQVHDTDGSFDSARVYVALDGGVLAQVSVQEMPGDEQPGPVLKDLVGKLD